MESIGFLAVEEEQQGICGGLLLVNLMGRPIEFHCTTPIHPNRAQQILYGQSLRPYLTAELIGPALLAKVSKKPSLLLVDSQIALKIRATAKLPVLWIAGEQESSIEEDHTAEADLTHMPSLTLIEQEEQDEEGADFALAGYRAVIDPAFPEDRYALQQLWRNEGGHFDLGEPFERIRQAIGEARRAAA